MSAKLIRAARALSILFTLFLSFFALDTFSEGSSAGEFAVALFMHLLPSFALIIATLIAWKNEKVGGIIFVLLGTVFTFFFHTYENIFSIIVITGVPLLVGILFLVSTKYQNQIESGSS